MGSFHSLYQNVSYKMAQNTYFDTFDTSTIKSVVFTSSMRHPYSSKSTHYKNFCYIWAFNKNRYSSSDS